jgi:nucleoside phosphorylase
LSTVSGQIDFGIITIRADEFRAVIDQFQPKWLVKGERHYRIAAFSTSTGFEYSAAIIRTPEQGENSAQQAANDLINELNPTCLVLIGIGGAKPEDDFTLGDVVVATRLHALTVRAALPDGTVEYTDMGGPIHPIVQSAISDLEAAQEELGDWYSERRIGQPRPAVELTDANFQGDEAWNKKVRESLEPIFGSPEQNRQPRAIAGAIAAANVLVKDSALLETWLRTNRDLMAVEMELPGVYAAARSSKGHLPILAIRGISDVIGFKRDGRWTAYACRSAASFARAFLAAGMLNIAPKQKRGILNIASELSSVRASQSELQAAISRPCMPGLPVVLPSFRRKPWPENIVTRLALDRTSLAAVTVGVQPSVLLDSCIQTETLLDRASADRFGRRRWGTWGSTQFPPRTESEARGVIWSIQAGDVSMEQLEEAVRTVLLRKKGERDVGDVLVFALDEDREIDARIYLDRLSELVQDLGVDVAVHGWSVSAYLALQRSLAGSESPASVDAYGIERGEQELIQLLRASRDARLRPQTVKALDAKSGFLSSDLRALCDWACGNQSVADFRRFLKKASAEACRVADLAGLLVREPGMPTLGDAERAGEIIGAAAANAELRIALVGLPVLSSSIEALVSADAVVRAAVGLVTRSEICTVPSPWSGYPVDLWRRGRGLSPSCGAQHRE